MNDKATGSDQTVSDSSHRKTVEDLRSQRWFARDDMRAFAHRQRSQQMGYRREEFMGRPVIGILNTWSDLSPCHSHLRQRADDVKRGIWQSGAFPVELPTFSLGEVMVKPTTMLYRNLLAMEVEELIRAHPIDGVVLLGGCDKTTPGLLMGAFSMDLPGIFVPAGPMVSGHWRGQTMGVGTHNRYYWDELRAGRITRGDWQDLESAMARSPGTCMTMGTASTMTSIVEAMGLTLPGASAIPAVDSAHPRMASAAGERIVQMVWEDLKPSDIVDHRSLENALSTYAAIGGSTNAAIHLVAMAGRLGLDLTLDAMDARASEVPCIVDIMPSGQHLMADLFRAGGLGAVLHRIRGHLIEGAMTVTGKPLGAGYIGDAVYDDAVIRPLDNPVTTTPTMAVLRGNLAPNGAVIKPSAASQDLMTHRGRALVFDGPEHMFSTIDDPDLDVDANTVLVMRYGGPVGGPGMPEWGNLPLPKKLLEQGVRDMVRLSDARMSGTHYGTCVLHIAPEAAVGGPLGLIETGDEIQLDVAARRLDVLVDEAELERRRQAWTPRPMPEARGYLTNYLDHVQQADEGCDFDFLSGPAARNEPVIF